MYSDAVGWARRALNVPGDLAPIWVILDSGDESLIKEWDKEKIDNCEEIFYEEWK